jgi:ribonuclease E
MSSTESNGPEATNSGASGGPADEAAPPARRTRRAAKATPPAAPVEAAAAPVEAAAGASAPAPARRRASRAAAAVPAEPVVVPAEPVADGDAPATRTRRRAKAASTPIASIDGESSQITPEPPVKATRSRRRASAVPADDEGSVAAAAAQPPLLDDAALGRTEPPAPEKRTGRRAAPLAPVFFVAPEATVVESGPAEDVAPTRARSGRAATRAAGPPNPVAAEAPAPTRPTRASGTRSAAPARAAAPAREAAAPHEGDDVAETEETPRARRSRRSRRNAEPVEAAPAEVVEEEDEDDDDELDAAGRRRRRRGRRGRGRGKGVDGVEDGELAAAEDDSETEEAPPGDDEEPLTRRRRRRRRSGTAGDAEPNGDEDGVVTVVRVRTPRAPRDEVQGVTGSTRLEAKRQRRRDGREQRRTRPPILSESEFLARREAVDRVMVVRQKGDRTQVAVLEDGILVEHYVTRQSASTMVGNVYLGKVQNVLPSMEAAFVDIGRGRNAVLYAGEVNWDATGLEGRARSIEHALKSGESVLVQVTKDPVGHKGARLTSHIALSGRHLVYVPNGHASGISRKLSDVERRRLRDVLKNLVPDGAGVIVRTAAEGAAEDDLERDVKRLQSQWEDIAAKSTQGGAPALLSAEPDLVIRVVRDLFNEDFREVVIQGNDAYEQVESYLVGVSPDLVQRVRRHSGPSDVFAEWRIDEQILKGLDRKVYLPSGGHLVIDRTEAMTVVDVNTGKYTGAGGNLEETVTRNNLEAAEEIVRQLRLRDIGGIVVIDFIDMVLESNRDLVLRRLTECLGRDRTKHQVTEITSLGLVQMTRKRIGQGLLEAFSETCDHCKGRGVIIQTEPVSEKARNNVAEKVRAVAASTRSDAVDEVDPDDGPVSVIDEDIVADEDADGAGTARRRARRGSSRRRTRP